MDRLDKMRRRATGNGVTHCLLCQTEFGLLASKSYAAMCSDCRKVRLSFLLFAPIFLAELTASSHFFTYAQFFDCQFYLVTHVFLSSIIFSTCVNGTAVWRRWTPKGERSSSSVKSARRLERWLVSGRRAIFLFLLLCCYA